MRIFFDSSAFVKRYIREEGTDTVLTFCNQATELCLSGIALLEIISAFCRLQTENRVSSSQYQQLKASLMADIVDAAICDLSPEVIRYSVIALESNVLRGMDAIHIGSALALKSDLFVTSDSRQFNAALQAGLNAEQI